MRASRNTSDVSSSEGRGSPAFLESERSTSGPGKLLQRRLKKAKDHKTERVKDLLYEYLDKIGEEHSYIANHSLRMAIQAHNSKKRALVNNESPFKNMKVLQRPLTEIKRQGKTYGELSVRQYSGVKGAHQSTTKIYFLSKEAESPSVHGIPEVPKYHEYTALKNNVLTEDHEELRYHPYFGEGEETDAAALNLEEAFIDKTKSASEENPMKEKAALYEEFIHDFLREAGVKMEWVKEYLIGDLSSHRGNSSMERTRLNFLPSDFDIENANIKAVTQDIEPAQYEELKAAELICKVFYSVTKVRLWEVIKNADEQLKNAINPSRSSTNFLSEDASEGRVIVNEATTTVKPQSIENYIAFYCHICHMFECPFHGIHSSDRENLISRGTENIIDHVFRPLTRNIPKACEKKGARRNPFGAGNPCSDFCFLSKQVSTPPSQNYEWTEAEIRFMEASKDTFYYNQRAPCMIAGIINRPCFAIRQQLDKRGFLATKEKMAGFEKEHAGVIAASNPTDPFKLLKRKRDGTTTFPDGFQNAAEAQKRDTHKPCVHSGPCGSTCSCVIAKVSCEKYCGCDASCQRRWKGCKCHASGKACSHGSKCECLEWGRECDPDLCKTCGALDVLNSKNGHQNANSSLCKNVALQCNSWKRTLIGRSNVAGIGLFIGEDVEANEFIGEYKGEVISHNEAERRGKLYDVRGVSFLFNLNRSQVVDATRCGNKLRFINHSRKHFNCYARVLFANCVHRIGLYATRKLYAGEELYFDYGYSQKSTEFVDQDPAFIFVPPNAKSKTRKIVAVSASEEDEDEDEDDDLSLTENPPIENDDDSDFEENSEDMGVVSETEMVETRTKRTRLTATMTTREKVAQSSSRTHSLE